MNKTLMDYMNKDLYPTIMVLVPNQELWSRARGTLIERTTRDLNTDFVQNTKDRWLFGYVPNIVIGGRNERLCTGPGYKFAWRTENKTAHTDDNPRTHMIIVRDMDLNVTEAKRNLDGTLSINQEV